MGGHKNWSGGGDANTVTSTAVAMKQTHQQTSIARQRLGKCVPVAANVCIVCMYVCMYVCIHKG
jgi:hypothetical protein